MLRARLIDLEGVTIGELAVRDGHPPPVIEVAAVPKLTAKWCDEGADPTALVRVKTIVYRLERRDGAGTLIYRRETGPWG
jgi:hypothetical protein